MRSVELFAGAGGLAIGMSKAGFRHAAVIEWDHNACETFRLNQRRRAGPVLDWQLHEGDVRAFDYGRFSNIMVVSGGPPCQPFSLGGRHQGYMDRRDMFPEAVRAVRELRPMAFIFENVRGLLREAFSDYFGYVNMQLAYPSIAPRSGEGWREHEERLEKHHTSRHRKAEYNVVHRLLNAADFGVPQRRERVFIVGFRSDLGAEWTFPQGEFSEEALLADQWIFGNYWKRHDVSKSRRPAPSRRQAGRVAQLRHDPTFECGKLPWRTVRDAIADLPDPEDDLAKSVANHFINRGARSYPGHTGSPYDEPAKTLKAGDHGVPGGENMLMGLDGSVRYFTVREAARIQTFPDDYCFHGPWTEAMRQLGNAVPVKLAETVARSVARALAPHAFAGLNGKPLQPTGQGQSWP